MNANRLPVIENEFLRLSFDPQDGRRMELCWRPSSLNLINHEARPGPTCDFRLNGRWVRDRFKTALAEVERAETEREEILRLRYAIGATRRHQVCKVPRYEMEVEWALERDRPVIRRRAAITLAHRTDYYGLHSERLTGVRYVVPGITIGDPIACTFEAPGERYRPRTPYRIRARLKRNSPEGVEDFHSLLTAPDLSPGILAIHNIKRNLVLLAGFEADREPVFPAAWGRRGILHLEHRHGLAGEIREGERVESGSQVLMVCAGDWPDAREACRRTILEPMLPLPPDRPDWTRGAVIGEVDYRVPGGLAAMRAMLPRWADRGVNTLYLMATNPGGYAVRSFEGVAPELGDEADLAALVREAHERGMRVLLDLLMTLQAEEGDLVRTHPDWFVRDARGRIQPSIAWGNCSIDWDHPAFQDYLIATALERVRRFDIDGFRVDAPEHKEVNWGIEPPRRASDTAFGAYRLLAKLRPALKACKPEAALLSETHGPVFHRVTDFSYAHPAYGVDWLIASVESGRLTGADLRHWLADQQALLPQGVERVFAVKTHDVATPLDFRAHPAQRPLQFFFALLGGGVMITLSGPDSQQNEGPELDFFRDVIALRRRVTGGDTETDLERPACDNENIACCLRMAGGRVQIPPANLSGVRQSFRLELPGAHAARRLWPDEGAATLAEGRGAFELGAWECALWEVLPATAGEDAPESDHTEA